MSHRTLLLIAAIAGTNAAVYDGYLLHLAVGSSDPCWRVLWFSVHTLVFIAVGLVTLFAGLDKRKDTLDALRSAAEAATRVQRYNEGWRAACRAVEGRLNARALDADAQLDKGADEYRSAALIARATAEGCDRGV